MIITIIHIKHSDRLDRAIFFYVIYLEIYEATLESVLGVAARLVGEQAKSATITTATEIIHGVSQFMLTKK